VRAVASVLVTRFALTSSLICRSCLDVPIRTEHGDTLHWRRSCPFFTPACRQTEKFKQVIERSGRIPVAFCVMVLHLEQQAPHDVFVDVPHIASIAPSLHAPQTMSSILRFTSSASLKQPQQLLVLRPADSRSSKQLSASSCTTPRAGATSSKYVHHRVSAQERRGGRRLCGTILPRGGFSG